MVLEVVNSISKLESLPIFYLWNKDVCLLNSTPGDRQFILNFYKSEHFKDKCLLALYLTPDLNFIWLLFCKMFSAHGMDWENYLNAKGPSPGSIPVVFILVIDQEKE